MPSNQPPERIGASFRSLDKEAQLPFGCIVRELRLAHNWAQAFLANKIAEKGQESYGLYRLWGDRNVRLLEEGGMSLTVTLVRVVAMALDADVMDHGLLYEVAGMNGVMYTVIELLKCPEHDLTREVYATMNNDTACQHGVLASFIASPLPGAPESATPVSLRSGPLQLAVAREVFYNRVTSTMTEIIPRVWEQKGGVA